eukprot:391676-Ditylum_brightwellii.AAC.1
MAVCFKSMLLQGIYQDDGLVGFQAKVNKLAGGNYLQFTTELWRSFMEETQAMTHLDDGDGWEDDGEILKALWKTAAVRDEEWFPFLDMRMRWWRNKLDF